MNPSEVKEKLIKEIITPFFKDKGFTKKGVKYFKDIRHCKIKIEVEIQSQRYYTEDDIKNFRINGHLYYTNMLELYKNKSVAMCGGFCIQGEKSWISINKNTDINELDNWLNNELEKLSEYLDEFNDIEKIINKAEISREGDNGLFYSYLLKENKREKELELWIREMKKQIEIIENELAKLNTEYESLEKREDSLDKEIKTEGITMMINEKRRMLENKNNVLRKTV
jgi:hypothetical protein